MLGFTLSKGAIVMSNIWCAKFITPNSSAHGLVNLQVDHARREKVSLADEILARKIFGRKQCSGSEGARVWLWEAVNIQIFRSSNLPDSLSSVCPGRNLADGMLWLAIASILTVFNISPEVDEDGEPVLPDVTKYTSGVMRYVFLFSPRHLNVHVFFSNSTTSRPEDFRCSITPRSPATTDLIR